MSFFKNNFFLLVIIFSINTYAQEAGEIDWKEWKAVVPSPDENGKSSFIEGKVLRKAKISEPYNSYIKRNSNDTYSLTANFTGVTEKGSAELLQKEYSNTELIEVYQGKKNNNTYWATNQGRHVLKTRIKVQESIGKVNITYLCRVVNSNNEDIARLVWNDGNLYALFFKPDSSGRRFSKIKIGKVAKSMFDLKVTVNNGMFTMAIKCEKTGLNKPNISLGRLKVGYQALFRLGNYFRNDDNYDDQITMQVKHADIVHKK